MKTPKDLKEKIVNEISKSGYPLEFYCQQMLFYNNWGISQLKHFLTPEGEDREIDVEADDQFVLEKDGKKINVFVTMIVECKKNHTNPWVFFKDKMVADDVNVIGPTDKHEIESRGHYLDKDVKLHSKHIDKAKSYLVPFKQDESKESRQIYEAISRVVNCFNYEHARQKKYVRRKGRKHYIHFYHLVVVFDGHMLLADVTKNKIKIKDTSHVLVGMSRSDEKIIRNYTLDVVQKKYFQKYLRILKDERKYLARIANRIFV